MRHWNSRGMKNSKVYFSRRDTCLVAIFAMMLVFVLWFIVDGVYEASLIFAAAALGIYLVLCRVKPVLIEEDGNAAKGAMHADDRPRDERVNKAETISGENVRETGACA